MTTPSMTNKVPVPHCHTTHRVQENVSVGIDETSHLFKSRVLHLQTEGERSESFFASQV